MATDILEAAKDDYLTAKDGWQEIYQKAADDLRFTSDEPFAQWDAQEASRRVSVGRPTVQIDQLGQFIHQVSNDIRQNTPTINVIPADDVANPETAEALSGRIKAIEYKSNAAAAYDMGADFAIKSSIGFIRVDHGYINNKSHLQELKIQRVVNPASIMIDPSSIESDGSDAKFGFVFEEISVKQFKRKWPKATPMSFGDEKPSKAPLDQDKITIAEYFKIEDDAYESGLLDDGTSEPIAKGTKYKSTRMMSKPKVMRYKLAGEDVLEETTFPGDYIPLVPVYGEEAWIEGKRNLYSLIRKAKSPAMMYNALKSSETEILLKQQQAPVQAAVGQMRGFEEDWKHPDKAMVLYYHTTDVNGVNVPPPERLQPPTVSAGFAQASIDAENNIRKTLGMYNAGVGKREGDASGVALKQLEMSGDVASLHFGDNLVRSITHVGKILVCALPYIEDTARIVQTIGKEDEMKPIGINGALAEGQKQSFDFSKGAWDVRVVTGPAFTTQRQEAAQFYQETLKILPPEAAINMLDLAFKYSDAPGAQAAAARLKKMVDPRFLDESEQPKDAENPQVAALSQQLQQLTMEAQQTIQQLQAELQSKQSEQQLAAAELQLKDKELDLKAIEVQAKLQQEQQPQNNDHETAKLAMDQQNKDREFALKEAEFHLKVWQATNQQEQNGENDMPLDDSIAMLQQKMQEKTQAKEKIDNDVQQRAAQEVAAREQRMMETQALMQGLGGIQQSLGQLVQAVQSPVAFVYDTAGNIVEAH